MTTSLTDPNPTPACYSISPPIPPSLTFENAYFPSVTISVGNLGHFDTNGCLMVALPPHAELDGTPHVDGFNGAWGGTPGAQPPNAGMAGYQGAYMVQKHGLITQTVAATPADQSRTNLGVGEDVYIRWNPLPPVMPTYTVTAGSIRKWSSDGLTWLFTAPSNRTDEVTLTATFPNGTRKEVKFTVFEPTEKPLAEITDTTTQRINTNVAGAWMRLKVFLAPTNVSFYKVLVFEPPMDATNVSDYFTNHWPLPHRTDQGAGVWHPVGQDNRVDPGKPFDTCQYAGSPILPYPWAPGGKFTWPIPAKWRVGTGPTNNLDAWGNQVFSLTADGTMIITKFGKVVSRTRYNEIYPWLPNQ
jgi:hypothetical protein